MRKCWAHCPEVRPSFRVLKEQLISVSQGLLNDWLNLLRCMRLSSPSGRSIQYMKSPSSLEQQSTSVVASSNSSCNSATLPSSHKTRASASLPSSVNFLHRSSSISSRPKEEEESSSQGTTHHLASQPSTSSSNVCDICSSYGHPWIELCKAIRATKDKWTFFFFVYL